MKMYHGTTKEALAEIIADGVLIGPVYMSPEYSTAESYAANNSDEYVVIEIDVDPDLFCADDEFVKGELDADQRVDESLKNGSVYIKSDVSVIGAVIH